MSNLSKIIKSLIELETISQISLLVGNFFLRFYFCLFHFAIIVRNLDKNTQKK